MTSKTGRAAVALAMCLLAICATVAFGRGKTFTNSGFEKKTFAGWKTKRENAVVGSRGKFVVYKGAPGPDDIFSTGSPRGGDGPPLQLRKPRRGKYAASSVQTGPGTRLLFRNINLKPNSNRKIAFLLSVRNYGADFNNPTPNSLHVGEVSQTPGTRSYSSPVADRGVPIQSNQQFRVDIVRKGADPYSIDPDDVIKNLLKSKSGDPLQQGWKRYSFNLSSLPPGKARLRVADADNQGYYFHRLRRADARTDQEVEPDEEEGVRRSVPVRLLFPCLPYRFDIQCLQQGT